jgi:hypothetical protein
VFEIIAGGIFMLQPVLAAAFSCALLLGCVRHDAPELTPPAAPLQPDNAMTEKNRFHDLTLKVTWRAEGASAVHLKYTVTNNSKQTYLLFNRGDMNHGLKPEVFYTEPQPDGVIEISQRAFTQPTDKQCRLREVPLYFGVSRLAPHESVSGELTIPLPLKYNAPYDDCSPQPVWPAQVKQIRFALGAIPDAKGAAAPHQGTPLVTDTALMNRQKLLFSDTFTLP